MTIEQRLDQLEQRNKRLTVALTMTVVAMCAVVTMAATGEAYIAAKRGDFAAVRVGSIYVTNDAGDIVVGLSATDVGNGLVYTMAANGNDLVMLTSTDNGNGAVTTYQSNGKDLVNLTSTDNGGAVKVYNKTGEGIVSMGADDYGNGVVWAGNRKGEGRTLQPGP